MKNVITRLEYPEIFSKIRDLIEETDIETYNEHRRASNYYTKSLVEITKEHTDDESIHGMWETETYIDDYEYGCCDYNSFDKLHRVKKIEQQIVEEYWVRVTE